MCHQQLLGLSYAKLAEWASCPLCYITLSLTLQEGGSHLSPTLESPGKCRCQGPLQRFQGNWSGAWPGHQDFKSPLDDSKGSQG